MKNTGTRVIPAPPASGKLPRLERVLAVCAHPDDESFGLGAVLAALAHAGTSSNMLCFTCGEASTLGPGTGDLRRIRAGELMFLAGDIDRRAICVARRNAVRNGVTGMVQYRAAQGYRDRLIRKSRYDLVLSNILARPLAVMAADLAHRLAPGGRAVLSGLLRRQEPIVLAPHRGCGIVLDYRLVIDGWSTLVMRRRHALEMTMGAEAPICEFGSVEGPVRLPLAGRASPKSGRAPALRMGRAYGDPRQGWRFASGEARYRRASDRRAPSARHRFAAGAATRKSAFRRK